ncbi:hypothetical protein [Nonomuraea sp. 10N515B]|uniref:hypothetical protein n=1 Tax=Nonomuraea sp. 10N515B TaxID=3457422 RepID=UPI003FCCF6F1
MRFSKPLTVTLVSAAMLALPFSGAALADSRTPAPTMTITPQEPAMTITPAQPPHSDRAKTRDRWNKKNSLAVSVSPGRVRAGDSYTVTITAKGVSSGTATVTSPEGRTYRVALSGGQATKTLTLPAKTKPGSKTVSVKVGNKVATASFAVVGGKQQQRDDHGRGHDGR